jgi:ribonuclease HI
MWIQRIAESAQRARRQEILKAYCDGACRGGNPGDCSCAWAIYDGEAVSYTGARYLGPEPHSNNHAEYQGLIGLLMLAASVSKTNLEIYSDSEVVIKQISGEWKVKEHSLQPLRDLAYALLLRGGHTLQHVKGHAGDPGNELVDRLCNETLDNEGIKK